MSEFLPFGRIENDLLIMEFSSFDLDLPIIASGVRERGDCLATLGIHFKGFGSEIPKSEVYSNQPINIKVYFEYQGNESEKEKMEKLRRAYEIIWDGIIQTFPSLEEYSSSRESFANISLAQAELLRIRKGESKE
ncbi:MAG: hypothetical protein EU551_02355 [Promethearchaeota archaeon]|nr:MAG: hypothetical protein EU551_02355 [Candidatus Lokiarchaeota archaeon]